MRAEAPQSFISHDYCDYFVADEMGTNRKFLTLIGPAEPCFWHHPSLTIPSHYGRFAPWTLMGPLSAATRHNRALGGDVSWLGTPRGSTVSHQQQLREIRGSVCLTMSSVTEIGRGT